MTASPAFPWWHLFIPKSVIALRQGYSLAHFRDDVLAGLTVAIVALPLAMALGIASGTTPDKGLITAVIAGFLISAFGGSRFQIGGPTGAFVVVVFGVIAKFGYDGLILATLMAGVMLMIAGFMRLGNWIKYIPQPVITGFTAGIAVIIFSSQIRDLFGLQIETVPGDFIEKWTAFWAVRDTANLWAMGVAAGALAIILLLRRFAPKFPAYLTAVIVASLAVALFQIPVSTIGTMFGGIPNTIPMPHWPTGITLEKLQLLLPSAFTIAFLAGVESLLSAVVADGMTGRRHKSNCELMAQGIANIASALFGGMPATGAIARTATNIRSGAKTPVAGMLHAGFVLLFMLLFARLASYIPLASLAAVLVMVAWGMSEIEKFRTLLRGPKGDMFVLLTTFVLTVAVDLTIAIEVGVVMGAILFMHRMSEAVQMQTNITLFESDKDDTKQYLHGDMRAVLPDGVEAFQIRGPLFFGVSSRLIDVLEQVRPPPRVFILRMGLVPMIDSSGATALEEFVRRCHAQGTAVILSGVDPSLMNILQKMGLHGVTYTDNFLHAIETAKTL
ncbi:MAG: SulP family inorganic anion transporter [Micavibrio sp.]